jgi:Bacterial surface proteins containing Ig-like domains
MSRGKRKMLVGIATIIFVVAFNFGYFFAGSPVGVTYQAQVQNMGWQAWKSNGDGAGTEGKSLRVEGVKMKLTNAPSNTSIEYQVYVQNKGWQPVVSNGQVAGITDKSLRIEAIKLTLKNMPGYKVQYQVYVQNVGWQNWVSDGQVAGTTGKSLRIEGLKVKITPKTPTIPTIPTKGYTGAYVKQNLYSLGFVDKNGGLTLNPYGAKGGSNYSQLGFTVGSGNRDMSLLIYQSSPEIDQKIKVILNWILPTKGLYLYNVLDTPTLKSKTLELDGRTVIIRVTSYGVALDFSKIK